VSEVGPKRRESVGRLCHTAGDRHLDREDRPTTPSADNGASASSPKSNLRQLIRPHTRPETLNPTSQLKWGQSHLLQSVTQRYRHNIMMTKLSKIDATRLAAATAVIEPLFARACDRMTGHSHAAEKMSTKPTITDFQEDWAKAQAARDAYLAE